MDHIDIIMNRYDYIKNELSYGKYGNVSIFGADYSESMSTLETFMQIGCSKECTLSERHHIYRIVSDRDWSSLDDFEL